MTEAYAAATPEGIRMDVAEEMLSVHVDTSLYGEDALFRACYQFTDRCYLFLRRHDQLTVAVEIRRRDTTTELAEIAGNFCNELIDQRLRVSIARDTAVVRDLIVRQAFAEARFDVPGA